MLKLLDGRELPKNETVGLWKFVGYSRKGEVKLLFIGSPRVMRAKGGKLFPYGETFILKVHRSDRETLAKYGLMFKPTTIVRKAKLAA